MKLNNDNLREDVRKIGIVLMIGGGLGYVTDKITSVDAFLLAACGIIIWLSALLEK